MDCSSRKTEKQTWFYMTTEEWDTEAKLNKYVEKLRNTPRSFPDLSTQMFEGAASTDCHSWGSSSTLPYPSEVFTAHGFEDVQCTQKENPTPHIEIPALT